MAISGYIKYIIKINFFSFFLLLLIWLLANLKWHMPLHHGSVGRCQPAPKSCQCHFMLQPCIVYRFRFFWGLSDSTSPCSLGYTPRRLCVFTTKLGMDLGSSLGLQYKIGEVTAVLSVARAASVKQERGVLSFPFIQMFLLF